MSEYFQIKLISDDTVEGLVAQINEQACGNSPDNRWIPRRQPFEFQGRIYQYLICETFMQTYGTL